jgi:hypothetical protein
MIHHRMPRNWPVTATALARPRLLSDAQFASFTQRSTLGTSDPGVVRGLAAEPVNAPIIESALIRQVL